MRACQVRPYQIHKMYSCSRVNHDLVLWETNSELQALYILLAYTLLFHLSLFSIFFWSVLVLEWGDIIVVDAIWEGNIFEK